MPKALVTLAVGSGCLDPWSKYLRAGWEAWCQRHGYQLFVFTESLDHSLRASSRSPAWQKLLAMASQRLRDFDQALWVDADVLINQDAPDPLIGLDPNLIAMTLDTGSPLSRQPEWFKLTWRRILQLSLQNDQVNSYYDLWGFDSSRIALYNTGVIAFCPALHSGLFLEVYNRWHDGGEGALHEMIPLNLVVQQLGMMQELDGRFNQLAGVQKAVWMELPDLAGELHNIAGDDSDLFSFVDALRVRSYFLYFAGAHQLMINYLRRCSI